MYHAPVYTVTESIYMEQVFTFGFVFVFLFW